MCEIDIIQASKIIEKGLLRVESEYLIVEKRETIPLIRTIDECNAIHDAFSVMVFPLQEDIIEEAKMIEMLNHQIDRKLHKMYRFYVRQCGIRFDDGNWGTDNSEFSETYRKQKATDNNIALICETVKSWEA